MILPGCICYFNDGVSGWSRGHVKLRTVHAYLLMALWESLSIITTMDPASGGLYGFITIRPSAARWR